MKYSNSKIGLLTIVIVLLTAIGIFAQGRKTDGGGTFFTISGNVRAEGANLPGANVIAHNGKYVVSNVLTDENGNYVLSVFADQTINIAVFKDGYNFAPAFQSLGIVTTDRNVNFPYGTFLCTPAPNGQTGGVFCPDGVPTNASQIVNGKIAFEIFGSTFGIDADGTNYMQLPPAGAFPSWSFDGTKLLYNRDNGTFTDQEIFITNADGTGNRQITVNFFNDSKAKFSPDGMRAVFNRSFNSSDIEIFTINTDAPNNGTFEIQLTNDDCLNQDPVYSPDGAKIAFSKFCENPQFSGIYTMNTDGSAPFQLTSGYYDISPTWRPDGARIVFERDGDFWFVNPSGTGTMQLTFDLQIPYFSPVYSPDGTKIAFSRSVSQTEVSREIYTLNPISGEQIRLTNAPNVFDKEYPSWQRIVAPTNIMLVGGLNLTFDTTNTAGNTVATPISLNSAGFLPEGFMTIPESVAYDIRTSANYTGNIEVCFDMSGVTDQKLFESLVVFHNENGELVDRTVSRDFSTGEICASVSSLSPFIVAAPAAPLAASVTVAGRILTKNGDGLANASVSLTDEFGNTRTIRTSSFGFFNFQDVEAGQTYTVTVFARRYNFNPQIVFVFEELNSLYIYAE